MKYLKIIFLLFWAFMGFTVANGQSVRFNSQLDASYADVPITVIDSIRYADVNDFSRVLGFSSIWFLDRDKIILRLRNNDNLILTVDNPFVVINRRVYNLLYPVRRNASGALMVPFVTFVHLLNTLYDGMLAFDEASNQVSVLAAPTAINKAEFRQMGNGIILSIPVPQGTLFDHSFFNNTLNLNFFGRKVDEESVSKVLSQPKLVRRVRVFNFEGSSQISIVFRTLNENPRVIFRSDINTIFILLRTRTDIKFTEEEFLAEATSAAAASSARATVAAREPARANVEANLRQDAKRVEPPSPNKPAQRRTMRRQVESERFVLVIDPGHGGRDPGAIGTGGTMEKDVVLDVGHQLRRKFEKHKDIKVIMTRDTDEFIGLRDRAMLANNNNAHLFLSLHCNSAGTNRRRRAQVRGFSVYFLSEARTDEARATAMLENQAIKFEDEEAQKAYTELDFIVTDAIQNMFLEESQYIGALINRHIRANTGQNPHGTGLDQAGFHVLRWAFMPAILVEMGFISHPEEEKNLRSPAFQRRMVKALYDSVLEYKRRFF